MSVGNGGNDIIVFGDVLDVISIFFYEVVYFLDLWVMGFEYEGSVFFGIFFF